MSSPDNQSTWRDGFQTLSNDASPIGEVDQLVAQYEGGSTVDTLAQEFAIHRTTLMAHLHRRGGTRPTPRKLTQQMVTEAERRYTGGETLAEIAAALGVSSSTVTRELRLGGTPVRRRGRPPTA